VQANTPHGTRAGTGPVPAQHAPAGAAPDGGALLPGPRPATGVLPAQLVPGARRGLTRPRPAAPDTVVFTAACPACGQDCLWSEERDDTRLRALVTCPCG
jgi:hypothetical protein